MYGVRRSNRSRQEPARLNIGAEVREGQKDLRLPADPVNEPIPPPGG